MPKYYFTSLARRPMTLSGTVFTFFVCSVSGGSVAGIYEAADPEEIKILDDAVRARRGIREIQLEEYEFLKKKGTQTPPRANSNGFKPRVDRPPTLPLSVEEKAGVPSADGKPPSKKGDIFSGPGGEKTGDTTRPSVANLLRTSKVNSPKPFAGSEGKTKKASARADRAKIRVVRAAE